MPKDQVKSSKLIAESEASTEKSAKEIVVEELNITDIQLEPKATAKAGKRSAKAIKETELKVAKEARKAAKTMESEETPATVQKRPRSRLERASKKLKAAYEKFDRTKEYPLKEAVKLAIDTASTKFDSTVELHLNMGVDPRQADQNIRGTVSLPAGTGKTLRIAVLAEADDAVKAKDAGADIAGNDDLLQTLDKNTINFDILIATPAMMPKLGKYAKLLGPKGLMPNPKSGTVSNDVAKAVTEAKAGRVEYRVDSTGIIHLGVGKVSFGEDKLLKNIDAVMSSIKAAKPTSIKGAYIQSAYLTTTMGPGIKVASI